MLVRTNKHNSPQNCKSFLTYTQSEIIQRQKYLTFNLITVIDFFCKCVLLLNLMTATRAVTGAAKRLESCGMLTPVWNIPQVN